MARYRCTVCGNELVTLASIEHNTLISKDFNRQTSFLCKECDFLVEEFDIKQGIANNPKYDIEEIKD